MAQTKVGELRNIANLGGLQAWLGSLGDDKLGGGGGERDDASRSWLLSVGKNWMVRHGAVHELGSLQAAPPESRAWVEAALRAGRVVQVLELGSVERERLAGVVDWLRSDDGPAVGSDWSKVSMEQAERAEKAWIEARGKAAAKRDLDAEDAAGSRLYAEVQGPDGREGWRWVEVESAGALDREGALMKHCVGSYARAVAEGKKSIYSLRDPDNKPWLTAEAQGARLTQLKAFANKPCPRELRAAVAACAAAFESEMAARGEEARAGAEIEKAGVVFVPGFGLGVEGVDPPAEWAGKLRGMLAGESGESTRAQEEALIALSRLGWTELVEIVLPACGKEATSKALEAAAGNGHLAMAAMLLPHSDPKAGDSQALSTAAENGHLAVAELLLPHSDPKACGSQALRLAAEKGHLAVVELLLPHSDPKAGDSWALRWAAEKGHLAVVELLLPHSDPKAKDSLALYWAVRNGHLAMAAMLLPHSDPKANRSHPLKEAAANGHLAMVELLLPHSDPKASESWALSEAAKNGHLAIVELLLPHSDPNARDLEALNVAAHQGHLAVVEALLPHSSYEGSRLYEISRVVKGKCPEVSGAIVRAIDARVAATIDPIPVGLGSKVKSRRAVLKSGAKTARAIDGAP